MNLERLQNRKSKNWLAKPYILLSLQARGFQPVGWPMDSTYFQWSQNQLTNLFLLLLCICNLLLCRGSVLKTIKNMCFLLVENHCSNLFLFLYPTSVSNSVVQDHNKCGWTYREKKWEVNPVLEIFVRILFYCIFISPLLFLSLWLEMFHFPSFVLSRTLMIPLSQLSAGSLRHKSEIVQ